MRNAFTFMISVAFIAGLFKFVEPTLADFSWNFALATGGVSLVLTSGLNRLLTPAIQRNAVRDDDSATIGNSSLAARLSKLDAIHRLKLNPRWRFMRKWGLVRKSWGLLAGCLCLPVSGLASDGIFDRLPYMRPLDLLVIIGGSLFVYLELRRIDRLEDQLHCLRDQYIRHLELDRKGISETHGAAGMEKYVCNCGNEESIWSKCKRWLTGLKEKLLTRKVKSLIVLFGLLSTGIVETAYGQTVESQIDRKGGTQTKQTCKTASSDPRVLREIKRKFWLTQDEIQHLDIEKPNWFFPSFTTDLYYVLETEIRKNGRIKVTNVLWKHIEFSPACKLVIQYINHGKSPLPEGTKSVTLFAVKFKPFQRGL